MKLYKIDNFKYKISNEEVIFIDKNNFLHFNFDTNTLIEVFDRFLEKIKIHLKEDCIFYQGDNVFLKDKYYTNKENLIIIYLRKYSYMIKSEYLESKDYIDFFKKRGNWTESKDDKNYVDFLFIQGGKFLRNKKLWNIKSLINNNVDRETLKITKKHQQHNIISEEFRKKFLNVQEFFELNPKFNPMKYKDFIEKNKIIIMKPTDGFGGKSIYIIDNYEQFVKIIKYLKIEKNKDKWSKRNKFNEGITRINWVLEKYIIDPHLYDNKKYHFRLYYIHTSDNQGFIYKKLRLAVAEKDYIKKDFKNTQIHDTHFVTNRDIGLIYLDQILSKENYENVFEQILILFNNISNNLKINCYSNTNYCFEIFAADLMLEKNLQVKLLEINTNPGFNIKSGFAPNLLDNILDHIIDNVLPPKNKPLQTTNDIIKVSSKNIERSPKGIIKNYEGNFVDQLAKEWYQEGYGPIPKKDKTGGYYLSCKSGDLDDFHIHVVGSNGKYHRNSWSRKIKERRKWEFLDFKLTAKEQAYHIYVKSDFRKNKDCTDYYLKHKK